MADEPVILTPREKLREWAHIRVERANQALHAFRQDEDDYGRRGEAGWRLFELSKIFSDLPSLHGVTLPPALVVALRAFQ